MIFFKFYVCTLYVIANFNVCTRPWVYLPLIKCAKNVYRKSWWYSNAKLFSKIDKTMMLIGMCVDIDVPPICDRY